MNKRGAFVQAMVGHLLDLYRLITFDVSHPHSYSKFRNIKHLARRTGATTFIEAGTYRGVTAARCARIFERVYTVELDHKLAESASAYLKRWKNIEVIRGDATIEVPAILERPGIDRVLVFLDGHFSAGDTARGVIVEPAVEEIRLLAKHRRKIRGIVIDDFRDFGRHENTPTKSALFAALETCFPDFEIMVHLDQVIVAAPSVDANHAR